MLDRAPPNKKENSMITLNYGVNNSVSRGDLIGRTIGEVKTIPAIKAYLGLGDSLNQVVNGRTEGDTYHLADGDVVTFTTKAAEKGC